MSAQEIVEVVGELVPDEGVALERQHGPQALAVAREVESALVPRLERNTMYTAVWQQFRAAPDGEAAPLLVAAVETLLKADAVLARRLDDLLAEYRRAAHATGMAVNTGGGAYVGGSVTVKDGDFVGRDKTVRITGDGNVVGDHSRATVIKHTGADADQVVALFERALELARAPQRPPEEQEYLEAAVEMAQQETEKGERADPGLLSKALDVLLEKGPDVLEFVLEAILSPAAAAGKGARMLARKAKEGLEKRR